MVRAEHPGAGLQHLLPVGEARAADLVAVQAPARLHQDRMGLRRPEQIAAALAQADRAVPQGLGQPGRNRIRWPGLQQRVRGAPDGELQLRRRDDSPGHGLDRRVHLHGPRGAGRVDRDQPGPGQAVHRVAGLGRLGRHGRVTGQVTAGGRAGEDDTRDTGRVEQGGQHQGGPGESGRRDLVGQVHGQRPGHARVAERGVVQARPGGPAARRAWARRIRPPARPPWRPGRRRAARWWRSSAVSGRGTSPGSRGSWPRCRSARPWRGPARAAGSPGRGPGRGPRSAGQGRWRAVRSGRPGLPGC